MASRPQNAGRGQNGSPAGGRSPLLRLAPFNAWADPACGLKDARLKELYTYWRDKRDMRPMPSRADIHPRDFKRHLPRIFLIDARSNGTFSFRLAGTALVDIFSCEPTGKPLDQALSAQAAKMAAAVFTAAVEYGRPMRTLGVMDWWQQIEGGEKRDFSHMSFEAVHLPLSPDGARVDIVLSEIVTYSGEDQPDFPEIPKR